MPYDLKVPGADFVLALQALPIVLVMSVLTTLLFYWRILPPIVRGFAWLLERTLGVGGAVGLSTAANIFLGMVEAPLFIRPYLASLTRSELFVVMTGGMAGIAGTVLVLYATLLGPVIPDAAAHLVIASVVGAPAAILVSLIMVPERSDRRIDDKVLELGPVASSTMDAIVKGTAAGLELLLNICAMLIVLVALVHLANAIIGVLPEIAGAPITLQRLLGYVMAPVCWLIGIPWDQAVTAGGLMGMKTILNEFIAYVELSKLPADALDPRSRLIMVYAMCGFANFALARNHDRRACHHGAGTQGRGRVAGHQVDRVGHARDLPDGRDRGGADAISFGWVELFHEAQQRARGAGLGRLMSWPYAARPGMRQLVHPELAVDRTDLGRPDQPRMGDRHRMQRPFQPLQPECQKAVERRKFRTEVVVLPDVGLQQGWMVGKPIEDLRRRQTIALKLAPEVVGCRALGRRLTGSQFLGFHDMCPPIRTPSVIVVVWP